MENALRPEHFINRELSWLEFNHRVLEEALNPQTPLLERLRFLSICSSNLDEFFMVRVAGLREQAFGDGAPQDFNPDGMTSVIQLREIARETEEFVNQQYACFTDEILPALTSEGIRIVQHDEVKNSKSLQRYFSETVFPVITPMAIDPSHPRPKYHNRGVYLAAILKRKRGIGPKRLFSVVQLPHVLPRLVPVEDVERSGPTFILLEDLIAARLPELFGGFGVEHSCAFRITRDSDLDVLEQESDDMLRMIEERLRQRRQADAVRLEISTDADPEIFRTICHHEQIRDGSSRASEYNEVYRISGPLDLTGFGALVNLPHFDHLRNQPFNASLPPGIEQHDSIFDAIARKDILLHHPYDDFKPVVQFIQRAAEDPRVLAIKQTLYRTSGDSPIVRALIQAAEHGKHVTAMVELKARFDEAANVGWARRMEQAGVHVVYGFMDLKTHTKIALVARRESQGVKRYLHLSTGNYNPTTASLYTDIGLFTCDEDIATDASALFNLLTGYSQGHRWRKLTVAPEHLHQRTIELIDEQAERARRGKPAAIVAKLNALVDHAVIEALYRASQAGVPIDLIVRGICCLRPGIPQISDNIRVRSIVDRFLEHSRVLVFGVEDNAKVFLSSADWMPRNFHRRVEVMFPIESPPLKKRILKEILPAYFKDNVRARVLQSDGTYVSLKPAANEAPYRCQHDLADLPMFPSLLNSSEGSNGKQSVAASKRERKPKKKKVRSK